VSFFVGQNRASNTSGCLPSGSRLPGRRACAWPNLLTVTLMALAYISCPLALRGQSEVDEYRLKAAFLFHFAQFVEWPSNPARGTESGFVFCVVGEDPFQGDLEGTVQGKSVSGKIIRVRHIKQPQDTKGCDVVFVDRNQNGRIPEFLAAVSDWPVLTVGDSDDFLRQGGMIRFCMEERKVRFEVNEEAAEKADLKVSSRLLMLAKSVMRRSGGK
jgi:hypothetical protein